MATILQWNINSFTQHRPDLELLLNHNPSVICLQETKAKENIQFKYFTSYNYFATAIDGSGFSGSVTFTLDDGTDTGQLKVIWMKDRGSYDAVVNVTSSYESHLSSITFNTQGDACILMWDGSGWFVLSNYGATVA